MAKNPMQRKAQNSFLLGMLITLLVTGIIIAFLVLQLTNVTKKQKKEEAEMKTVYILNQSVASGQIITSDMLVSKKVSSTMVPGNATTALTTENAIAKIDLQKGTVLADNMYTEGEELGADVRKMEYNMIMLPSQLNTDEYVDIRLKLPNGKDFIVVSHKKVTIPELDGAPSLNTISVNMNEVEILTMSCAIVEAYKIEGSILYANQYIEPGMQKAATLTYMPDDDTIRLINKDPNCVTTAINELNQRTQSYKSEVRNPINSGLNENGDQATDNAVSGLQEELQKAQEERQKYLESLGGSY